MQDKPAFKDLFKKYRLRSGFATLNEFGKALSGEGYIFEDSLLSRWQRGSRIPRDRKVLISILKIFLQKKSIKTLKETNTFLGSAGQGYITESELLESNAAPNIRLDSLNPKNLLDFIIFIGKSKKILRTGWVREKIVDPESVAEHSFRVSVLSMAIAERFGLDKEKLIQMAILHDLGELITGDLVWSRGTKIDIKKRQKKEKLEKEGIIKIFKLIDEDNQYASLYDEMIERKTDEAKFFWQLDKLEMAIQSLEYENSDKKNLSEFFINADLQIDSPFLKKVMDEISLRRKGINFTKIVY